MSVSLAKPSNNAVSFNRKVMKVNGPTTWQNKVAIMDALLNNDLRALEAFYRRGLTIDTYV